MDKSKVDVLWVDPWPVRSDTHSLNVGWNISRPHSDAENKSAWNAKTVITCTCFFNAQKQNGLKGDLL